LLRLLAVRSGEEDVEDDLYAFDRLSDVVFGEFTSERPDIVVCFSAAATTVGLLDVLKASPSSTSLPLESWLPRLLALIAFMDTPPFDTSLSSTWWSMAIDPLDRLVLALPTSFLTSFVFLFLAAPDCVSFLIRFELSPSVFEFSAGLNSGSKAK
jgi:hypothetical protein